MSETEWQAIDTAPKNGEFIMLKGGKTSEQFYDDEEDKICMARPVIAKWIDADGFFPGYWSFAFFDGDWRISYDDPTHWRYPPD